jgi:hypothetical protein
MGANSSPPIARILTRRWLPFAGFVAAASKPGLAEAALVA